MTKPSHLQLQILESLQSMLLAANTDAGTRVRVEGLNNLSTSALPAIEIEVSDEEIERRTMGAGGRATLQRDLIVEVGCLVKGGGDYLKRASELMAQVEEALFPDGPTELDCLLDGRPRLRGTRPQHDDRGAEPVYRIRIGWIFRYFTAEGRPRALGT
ncbi:hypothetical protein [Comamonas testosteroni]|uniref:hypothetical protein n=1 Tax=Comamonas testosteroni TaxID=285 RepID=UPI0006B8B41E|nr:hypothetical protein [Comamonas testosteroni]